MKQKKTLQFTKIIRDKLGLIVGTDNWLVTPTTNIPSGRVASIRKQIFLCNPHLYLASAIGNPLFTVKKLPEAVVENTTTYGVLEITEGSSPAVKLFIDASTRHIKRLETLEKDHLYRAIEFAKEVKSYGLNNPNKFCVVDM